MMKCITELILHPNSLKPANQFELDPWLVGNWVKTSKSNSLEGLCEDLQIRVHPSVRVVFLFATNRRYQDSQFNTNGLLQDNIIWCLITEQCSFLRLEHIYLFPFNFHPLPRTQLWNHLKTKGGLTCSLSQKINSVQCQENEKLSIRFGKPCLLAYSFVFSVNLYILRVLIQTQKYVTKQWLSNMPGLS